MIVVRARDQAVIGEDAGAEHAMPLCVRLRPGILITVTFVWRLQYLLHTLVLR